MLYRARCLLALACCAGLACTGEIGGVSSSRGAAPESGAQVGTAPSSSAPGLGTTPEEIAASCAELGGELDAGLTRLRRLTRRELENTLRDLLGVEADVEGAIAPDERVGPFYSNAVAPPTDLLVEQYQELAVRVASEVEPRMAELSPCDLGGDAGTTCAAQFVTTFGSRAYRRPLESVEVEELVDLYEIGRQSGGAAGGFGAVIEAMLQSPFFLYHSDAASPGSPSAVPVALDPYALASRLSYFLWSTMPDDELQKAAANGALGSDDALRGEVERMLQSAKAADMVAAFHRQWLGLANLAELDKDPTLYPQYGVELASAMLEETARFTQHVVLEADGLLETLLTSNLAFPQGPLFQVYGLEQPAGFVAGQSLELDPTRRAGLLTQAAFLTRHAHGNQTSPVHRGIVVRENLLCQPMQPPPPGVNPVAPPPTEITSTRERFAQHVSDPSCAGCHQLVDPIGLGFEHYDAIGAYRETDGLGDVDASGELKSVRDDLAGPFDGAVELAAKLAQSSEVADCVARQWFRFSLGRVESKSDACSIQGIQSEFKASSRNVRTLLAQVVLSDAFRHVRSTAGDAP